MRLEALATPSGMGETRVPAACCGLYSYRPTPGMPGAPSRMGAPATGGVAVHVPALVARDLGTLMRAAEGLGVTGEGWAWVCACAGVVAGNCWRATPAAMHHVDITPLHPALSPHHTLPSICPQHLL